MHRSDIENIRGSKGEELANMKIALCITGSIAAYRAVDLARELVKHGADVYVVMTENATKLVCPTTFEWATGNPVITEYTGSIEHIELAESSDLILVAPATANTIAKVAYGVSDTTVSLLLSAAIGKGKTVLMVPAMHIQMYRNPFLVDAMNRLKEYKVSIIEPKIEEDKAKFPDIDDILYQVFRRLYKNDLKGRRILVTGGATIEHIDPVRIITNKSSGKMGLEIAREAYARGADVTLVLGRVSLKVPRGIEVRHVETTEDLLNTVLSELDEKEYDAYISAAAPVDFTPLEKYEEKLDTRERKILKLDLGITPKVVREVRKRHKDLFIIAFKAIYHLKDDEIINKAIGFAQMDNIDIVVANDLARQGVGFEVDTNEVFITDKERLLEHIPVTSKKDIARRILDHLIDRLV